MRIEPGRLKAFLLDAGLVAKDRFESALKRAEKTNQDVGDVLVSEGLLNKEELIKLQAYILGIPFVDLKKEIVPREILSIIPEPIAKKHNIVPFKKNGKDLEVAMLDPEDLRTIEFIKKKADLRILPRLTTPDSIKNILMQYQKTLEAEFGEIIKKEAEGISHIPEELTEEKKELEKIAQELPTIKIVDTLIYEPFLPRGFVCGATSFF